MNPAAGITKMYRLKEPHKGKRGPYLLAATLSGYLAALYHVPCPPFEWPMMITFSGANAHAFHLEDDSRMVVSAETVPQASSALGP